MQTKSLQTKRALRTALLVLLLSVAGMGKGYAQNFTVDGLNYSVNDDGVSVTLIGYESALGELVIPESVTHEAISYSVTAIGDSAFGECDYFTGDLIIPNSVTTIGNEAFYKCWGFEGGLTIGNSVTSIGEKAFCLCEHFTGDLTIPNSVTSIGEEAFCLCEHFTGDLTIPNSVTTIGNGAFYGCSGFTGSLTIPNSVTTIGNYAFYGCSGFNGSLTIGNSVTTIGVDAFYNCNGFTGSLTIGNSVTSIGESAFEDCIGFTGSLTIPNSVTSIESCAFYGCSGLTSITIPNSVTTIGLYVFDYCRGLEQIIVKPGNTVYDSRGNCNAIIETSSNRLICGCKSTVIPNSVTGIGSYAFAGCSGFTGSLTIPNSVTYIGWGAFLDCSSSMGSLIIGNSVATIEPRAFEDCIGFINCIVLRETPPGLSYWEYGDFSHFGESFTHLIVPCGCKENYENCEPWAYHFTTIEEDCDSHSISMDNISYNGGMVSVSTSSANLGEEVQITVTPNAGMSLSSLTVFNASDPSQTVLVYPIGKASSMYGFLMPPYDVAVKAVFVLDNAVGESNSIAMSVYPNPTNGQVIIEAEGIKHVTICNALGQVIYESKTEGDVFEYDFSGQKAGIYLARIETANGVVVKKVSVTR